MSKKQRGVRAIRYCGPEQMPESAMMSQKVEDQTGVSDKARKLRDRESEIAQRVGKTARGSVEQGLGEDILYASYADIFCEEFQFYLASADGSEPEPIGDPVHGSWTKSDYLWLPNGSSFIFMTVTQEDKYAIERCDLASRRSVIRKGNEFAYGMRISPSGSRLLFVDYSDAKKKLIVMNQDGTGSRRIATEVYFADFKDDNTVIFLMYWQHESLNDGSLPTWELDKAFLHQVDLARNEISLLTKFSHKHILSSFTCNRDTALYLEQRADSNSCDLYQLPIDRANSQPQLLREHVVGMPAENRTRTHLVCIDAERKCPMLLDKRGKTIYFKTPCEQILSESPFASWSPDSTRLAYTINKDGDHLLYVADLSGKSAEIQRGRLLWPRWRPLLGR